MKDATRILVIDDDRALLVGIAKSIRREGDYQVLTADNGNLGIQLAREVQPHVIVCDLMMPPPDGWAVLKSLSENPTTATIPFIFLTARAGEQDKIAGMDKGADDYVAKPFSNRELLARIRALIRRKNITQTSEQERAEKKIVELRAKIQALMQQYAEDQAKLAEAMAQMLAMRDNETEAHARRVAGLSIELARELGLQGEALDHIRLGALLHDIGKVGIPDAILLKSEAMTPEDRKTMMLHPLLGGRIIKPLGLPKIAEEIVKSHHERWDGAGYPDGLEGEQIPFPARIFAVVDVWDAITSDRPYRKAWSVEKARTHLNTQSGSHFDPKIVEAFLSIIECRWNED